MKEVHSGIRYTCPTCGEAFPRNESLKRHMVKHTDEKPHVCEVCPDETSRFKTKDRLRQHMNRHDKAKHQCDLCKVKFFTAAILKRHRQLH